MLDTCVLPEDNCQALSAGIRNGTASIVSGGSFNPASPIGPVGTLAVMLAPSTECPKRHWAKGCNWVNGPISSQSAYRSELTGVIALLTIIDILVRHHSITEGAVTIALDGKTAMEEASGDWPLRINQKCFDYLQIIRACIKLSPLSFTFRHVKGHQTKEVDYNQLDWWGQRNEDVDAMAKEFLFSCTEDRIANRKHHRQPTLHLEKWALAMNGIKFTSICIDLLYINLYGSRTLAYWNKKDNTPNDPKRILWEESRLAMKQLSRA